MPRIYVTNEDIIKIDAGAFPAPGAGYWYSGRGNDASPSDGGGPDGQGSTSSGKHVDAFHLILSISAWDAACSGLEVRPEICRDDVNFSAIDHQVLDADAAHTNIKPLIYQVLKADWAAGSNVLITVPVVCKRIRFGVRGIGAGGGTTALTAALEFVRAVVD
jgi:hypothetical protein